VLRAGRVVGEVGRAEANQEVLLRMMAGLEETFTPTNHLSR
jgi:ABC-type uncharacterized transport system ATPase subunit